MGLGALSRRRLVVTADESIGVRQQTVEGVSSGGQSTGGLQLLDGFGETTQAKQQAPRVEARVHIAGVHLQGLQVVVEQIFLLAELLESEQQLPSFLAGSVVFRSQQCTAQVVGGAAVPREALQHVTQPDDGCGAVAQG